MKISCAELSYQFGERWLQSSYYFTNTNLARSDAVVAAEVVAAEKATAEVATQTDGPSSLANALLFVADSGQHSSEMTDDVKRTSHGGRSKTKDFHVPFFRLQHQDNRVLRSYEQFVRFLHRDWSSKGANRLDSAIQCQLDGEQDIRLRMAAERRRREEEQFRNALDELQKALIDVENITVARFGLAGSSKAAPTPHPPNAVSLTSPRSLTTGPSFESTSVADSVPSFFFYDDPSPQWLFVDDETACNDRSCTAASSEVRYNPMRLTTSRSGEIVHQQHGLPPPLSHERLTSVGYFDGQSLDDQRPFCRSTTNVGLYADLTPPAPTRDSRITARALYSFTAQSPRELSFEAGDTFLIRHSIDNNWYEAELNGRIGIVPSNYVEGFALGIDCLNSFQCSLKSLITSHSFF
ncbi:unnamed protein product [Soboliphyme baturini]|uniref:SH3 domain-containing protein n=1 Tax=Soboliphyme baturini TaxID=241478 RepID=A0A183ICV1_9BILA|nr:unnamed protein product [Soboliphyme baturini]